MTAEFAVILPAVAALAILLCCLGRAVVVRVECQDAARTIARRAAQQMQVDAMPVRDVASGLDAWADSVAAQLAGSGADATLTPAESGTEPTGTAGSGIEVRVRAPVIPDPLRVLPAVVEGCAFAWSP